MELCASPRPTACTGVIECGSIGRLGKLVLYSKLGLAGMVWLDRLRAKTSRLRTAAQGCVLWDTEWSEAVVSAPSPRGPWLGAANHGRVVGIFDSYHKTVNQTDAVYRFAYPHIIFFMYCGRKLVNPCAEEHSAQIWDELPFRPLLRHPGSRAKKSRW